jgi:hypothetical protein
MALLALAAVTFSVVNLASAATPTQGAIVPNAATALSPFTPNTPFSSGQGINVVVPANSLFPATQNILIVECSAPNGAIPTTPAACDGNTINSSSIEPNTDGSIDFNAETGAPYPVFFTPDPNFGENSSTPSCGDTAATECILYIGNNQNDFTAPHVWSNPFFVSQTADKSDSGANPGDGTAPNPGTGTPEVPFAILLPVAGLGLLGGTVLIRRRRAAVAARV